jgi:hypothetical protein
VRRGALAAALFVFSLAVFLVSPLVDTADSTYSMVLSESILHHHSTNLNWFRAPGPVDTAATSAPPLVSSTDTYQLGWLRGRLVYRFPNGSSILSLPFVEIANLAGLSAANPDGSYHKRDEFVIQRVLASLLMATLVVLVLRSSMLLLPAQKGLLIAIAFAFGTQVWSTATRALWGHTWMIFLEGWVVYLLLKYDDRPEALPLVILATLLSWMYFVRATAVAPIACVTLYIWNSQRPQKFLRFAIVGALWFVAFVVYSWLTFGELIPGYYHSHLSFQSYGTSLAANLISPSRGLFVYVPISLFVVYLSIRHYFTLPHRRLAILSLGVISSYLVILGGWPIWWGGHSYGPRYTTDLLPWLVMLAILATAEAKRRQELLSTRLGWQLAFVLITLSIVINARGATSRWCHAWNAVVAVDQHPERVFDWSFPQFAAGLVHPPPYADLSRFHP